MNLPKNHYREVRFSGSQPGLGIYNLNNIENNEKLLSAIYSDSDMDGFYNSSEGKIEITYATDSEIKGKFNFPIFKIISKDNGESERYEMNVSGKFYSVEGNSGIELE